MVKSRGSGARLHFAEGTHRNRVCLWYTNLMPQASVWVSTNRPPDRATQVLSKHDIYQNSERMVQRRSFLALSRLKS